MKNLNLGRVPEKMKTEGIFVHYRDLAKIGDTIKTVRNVLNGQIPKGTIVQIEDISITPKPNIRGFEKRIKLKDYDGDFNPKRFKLVKE